MFYHLAVFKPLLILLAVVLVAGCSDQMENENASLKFLNRSLAAQRKVDDDTISTLSSNVTFLKEQVQQLHVTNATEIIDLRRTTAMLTSENVRQKEDLENVRRTLVDERALHEKYKEEVTKQLQKPARVKFTLTYKYDSASAPTADNGATVSLHCIKDTTIAYHATTGADGVAVLDRVKPGKYLCVMHSGNAHQRLRPGGAELIRQRIWKTDASMLSSYLDAAQIKMLNADLNDVDATGHFLEALLSKTTVQELEIGPNDEVDIPYDFGQGAF
jgi:hypothetical protein